MERGHDQLLTDHLQPLLRITLGISSWANSWKSSAGVSGLHGQLCIRTLATASIPLTHCTWWEPKINVLLSTSFVLIIKQLWKSFFCPSRFIWNFHFPVYNYIYCLAFRYSSLWIIFTSQIVIRIISELYIMQLQHKHNQFIKHAAKIITNIFPLPDSTFCLCQIIRIMSRSRFIFASVFEYIFPKAF